MKYRGVCKKQLCLETGKHIMEEKKVKFVSSGGNRTEDALK